MESVFGNRSISIIKEITKIHETLYKTTLSEAIAHFENNPPKGEYVLVLAGKSQEEADIEKQAEFQDLSVVDHVDLLISKGLDKKEAIKEVAKLRNLQKRQVYNEYISMEED
jgi:16S rRNA (cytidine1402-2'-O)-methyltransferase